jgi:protein phosphatase 2C family protein 2/3
MSNEDVVQFVRKRLGQGLELDVICEQMMDACLAGEAVLGGMGCDNMTVIIVGFLNGLSKEKWLERFKE